MIAELKSGGQGKPDPSGARPGPRRGGHRLAYRRGDRRPRENGPARPVQRPDAGYRPGSPPQPPRTRFRPVRGAAGPPDPRSPRGLPDQPDSLGQGQARAFRRPSPVRRRAHHLRPRGGDQGLCPRGVLDPDRPARRVESSAVRSQTDQDRREKGQGRRHRDSDDRPQPERPFTVSSVDKKEVRRQPPPFTTSKLSRRPRAGSIFGQESMSRPNVSTRIELGAEGSVGLITYMRTDSVRIADA